MTPVAVAAVMSMSMTTLILAALVVTMTARMLPPKPSAVLAAEQRARFRAASEPDGMVPYDTGSHPSYPGPWNMRQQPPNG
ncbi:hypothetical protein [Streptomyces alboflavus]|uniref:hypothetical protein n=1 Tax=Streptomyces alboflavus TaxID=67267 RepID=UPI00369AABC5